MAICILCGSDKAVRRYCPECKKQVIKEHNRNYNKNKRKKVTTKKLYKNVCKECGEVFETEDKKKLTCSQECSDARKKRFMAYVNEWMMERGIYEI